MVVKDNDIVGIIKKKDIVQIISTVTAASSLLPISPTDFVKASFSKEEISEESISDKKENEEPLLDSLSPLDSL